MEQILKLPPIVPFHVGDEIRRVILESILPFLKELLFAKKMERKEKKDIPYDVVLNDYDLFDDYLEMVIQFGVRDVHNYSNISNCLSL